MFLVRFIDKMVLRMILYVQVGGVRVVCKSRHRTCLGMSNLMSKEGDIWSVV